MSKQENFRFNKAMYVFVGLAPKKLRSKACEEHDVVPRYFRSKETDAFFSRFRSEGVYKCPYILVNDLVGKRENTCPCSIRPNRIPRDLNISISPKWSSKA